MFVDTTFVPIIEAIASQLHSVEKYIVLTDQANMPDIGLPGAIDYESWLATSDPDFKWANFDENTAAALCYTSGTTGNPKGVLYSHMERVQFPSPAPFVNSHRMANAIAKRMALKTS